MRRAPGLEPGRGSAGGDQLGRRLLELARKLAAATFVACGDLAETGQLAACLGQLRLPLDELLRTGEESGEPGAPVAERRAGLPTLG